MRTQLATDLATNVLRSNGSKKKHDFLTNDLQNYVENRLLDRPLTGYVWWVITVGTVHGYGGYGRWVQWIRYMGNHGYGGPVHEYGTYEAKHVPNTRTRPQHLYPTTLTVPNAHTQQPYPHPTPLPNDRTSTQQPYPTTVPNLRTRTQQPYQTTVPVPNHRTQPPYPTPVPVPVPIKIPPRTLRNRPYRDAWFHCF